MAWCRFYLFGIFFGLLPAVYIQAEAANDAATDVATIHSATDTAFNESNSAVALNSVGSPPKTPPSIDSPSTAPYVVPDYDLLALSTEIEGLLDKRIRRFANPFQRLARLQQLFYSKDQLHIRYRGDLNLDAVQTFNQRQGNCISLANLFIAAARYVGLEANYQFVDIEREWKRRGELLEVPAHINVRVRIAKQDIHIEFNGNYALASRDKKLRHSVISDGRAKAEFYNNLGVHKLTHAAFKEAETLFKHAISLAPDAQFSWSNLGVAYKLQEKYDLAESSYLEALKIDSKNETVAKNLHILYSDTGDAKKAKKYQRRVEAYARKNPYYLEKLALDMIEEREYEKAKKYLRKAIKIHANEASFYHTLSVVHFQLKDLKASSKALNKAMYLANSDKGRKRYGEKLSWLAQQH